MFVLVCVLVVVTVGVCVFVGVTVGVIVLLSSVYDDAGIGLDFGGSYRVGVVCWGFWEIYVVKWVGWL